MQADKLFLSVALIFALLNNCATNQTSDRNGIVPEINASTSIEDAISIAINHGGDRLGVAVKKIREEKKQATALLLLKDTLKQNMIPYQNHQLINAGALYAAIETKLDLDLFEKYLRSGRDTARKTAWQWAAILPSNDVAKRIDEILSVAIQRDEERSFIVPEMAAALSLNKLNSAYGFLRTGLMEQGDEAFARAMIDLDKEKASEDFLDYLSLVPLEELRQLNQKSLNQYTSLIVFKHLAAYPPSVNHRNFEQLFLYAVSRNQSLSELANQVLKITFIRNRESVASVLGRLPSWIQITYLEYARRNMSPEMSSFLLVLKERTGQDQVIEEIDEIVR